MAWPRNENFEERLNALAAAARVFSHPARLAIIEVLVSQNSCICGELVDELPLAQATVSQHLKVLKEAGVIDGVIEGPRTCYCIDRKNLEKIETAFQEWFSSIKEESCC